MGGLCVTHGCYTSTLPHTYRAQAGEEAHNPQLAYGQPSHYNKHLIPITQVGEGEKCGGGGMSSPHFSSPQPSPQVMENYTAQPLSPLHCPTHLPTLLPFPAQPSRPDVEDHGRSLVFITQGAVAPGDIQDPMVTRCGA